LSQLDMTLVHLSAFQCRTKVITTWYKINE